MAHNQDQSSRQPRVRIPLSFDDAVGGLLAVDPKGLPKSAAKARKVIAPAGKKPVKDKAKKRAK